MLLERKWNGRHCALPHWHAVELTLIPSSELAHPSPAAGNRGCQRLMAASFTVIDPLLQGTALPKVMPPPGWCECTKTFPPLLQLGATLEDHPSFRAPTGSISWDQSHLYLHCGQLPPLPRLVFTTLQVKYLPRILHISSCIQPSTLDSIWKPNQSKAGWKSTRGMIQWPTEDICALTGMVDVYYFFLANLLISGNCSFFWKLLFFVTQSHCLL